jgi:hypothetical protein
LNLYKLSVIVGLWLTGWYFLISMERLTKGSLWERNFRTALVILFYVLFTL